jgi:hypothetical protein
MPRSWACICLRFCRVWRDCNKRSISAISRAGPSRGIQTFGPPAISRYQTTIVIGAEEGINSIIPDTRESARSLAAMSSRSERIMIASSLSPTSSVLTLRRPGRSYMISGRFYPDDLQWLSLVLNFMRILPKPSMSGKLIIRCDI